MIAELRELESDHADQIWRVYGMSCQKFLARNTGIAQPNISVSGNRMRRSTSRHPVMT